MSHGATEVGAGLLGAMAREMRISKNDFLLFVECKLSGEIYLTKMLSENQVQELPPEPTQPASKKMPKQ